MIDFTTLPRLACTALLCLLTLPGLADSKPPNLVVILSDDMGYSDLGCFGGEIHTPNIDKLAANGVRMMQFYNTGRCCPTRASLISGLHPHQAGVGHMTNGPGDHNGDFGTPAYQGHLDTHITTLPQALKSAGYRTLMAGKWHLGIGDPSLYPCQRGFDRFYGVLAGGTNYFKLLPNRGLTLDNNPIAPEGENFYLTDAITDYAIRFVEEEEADNDARPFFLYLAYTAPHWPLQALKPDIDRYRDRYTGGWEKLREERYARMKQMGLIQEGWGLSPRNGRAWDALDQKKQNELALRMAIYAAQIDRMDQNIGRLIEKLDTLGELDNTMIVFFNDNGACAEGGQLGGGPAEQLETREGWFLSYGQMWANASNTPYRMFKHYIHEGGIATPAIVHWPAGIAASENGKLRQQPGYLPDLMPTLLDAAGATDTPPTAGVSLLDAITTDAPLETRPMFWEHEGNAAIRVGDMKLVRRHDGNDTAWELYNLAKDRSELHDLAREHQDLVSNLAGQWQTWADEVGVLPWRGARAMRKNANK